MPTFEWTVEDVVAAHPDLYTFRGNRPTARPKAKPSTAPIDRLLGEASWLLSHAQALGDYGRRQDQAAELARAATCEEQVACLLDADGQELEAALHRVSAAACHEQLGQPVPAVTLLRAALAADLPADYRGRVEGQPAQCLAQASRELTRVDQVERGEGAGSRR
jgi:hypothetical protein